MPPFLQSIIGRFKSVLWGSKKHGGAPSGGVADRKDFPWLVVGGTILSASAGWVNAFCFMALRLGGTHVTGTVTKVGMAIATGDQATLSLGFGLWFCFCLGGVFAGIIIINESFALGRSYGHAFLIVSAFLLWASIWAIHFQENESYLYVVATAAGIQNGVTTRYSGNVVRTTHMSGLTTDLGITFGHMLRCHPKPDFWKVKLYGPMLLGFMFGGTCCAVVYPTCRGHTLLFPTAFIGTLGFTYIGFLARLRRQPFHKVLLKRVSQEIMTPNSPTHRKQSVFAAPPPRKESFALTRTRALSSSMSPQRQQSQQFASPAPEPPTTRRARLESRAVMGTSPIAQGSPRAAGGTMSPREPVLDRSGVHPDHVTVEMSPAGAAVV